MAASLPLRTEAGFRIVTLLPATDNEAPICCDLTLDNLESEPYYALSYVWGDPDPMKTVTISGREVRVTPNLFAAMRRLRHETKLTRLWIDALCINQDDMDEKSSQVRQMGDIFHKASFVIMWLGEDEDDGATAVDLIGKCARELRRSTELGDKMNIDLMLDLVSNQKLEQAWSAVERLFQRPYWTRVWIVQEVLLSRRTIIQCGSAIADWSLFMIVLSQMGDSLAKHASFQVRDILLSNLQRHLSVAFMNRVRNNDTTFLETLVLYRTRHATDFRDKVYACLNLVAHDGFEADYNKRLVTVYRDVVKYLVEKDGNLDVLSACRPNIAFLHGQIPFLRQYFRPGSHESNCRKSDDSNEAKHMAEQPTRIFGIYLPSWIPDWRFNFDDTFFLRLKQPKQCHYRACGDTKPKVRFLDEQYVMVVEGVRFDDIKYATPHSGQLIRKSPDPFYWIGMDWESWRLGDHPKDVYGSERQQQEAYLRTLIAARSADGTKSSTIPVSIDILNKQSKIGFPDDIQGALQMSESSDDQSEGGYQRLYVRDLTAMASLQLIFSFCITRNGFMGRVPLGTEAGDVIATFLGSKVPFVLRGSREEGYFLLGECYVDGIMEGEVMEQLETGKKSLEEFVLF